MALMPSNLILKVILIVFTCIRDILGHGKYVLPCIFQRGKNKILSKFSVHIKDYLNSEKKYWNGRSLTDVK